MTTVRFNVVDEFLHEMERDGGDLRRGIERDIVRVTTETRTTAHFPVRNLLIVATYKVAGHPTIVRLDVFVGQIMGYPADPVHDHEVYDHDREIIENAYTKAEAIRAAAAALHLDCRAGVIEDRDGGRPRDGKR